MEIKDKRNAENVAACHLSRLEDVEEYGLKRQRINDFFLEEYLYEMQQVASVEKPWFIDFANYLSEKVLPKGFNFSKRRNFLLTWRITSGKIHNFLEFMRIK